MKLFSQLVKTAVNIATLPVSVVKDVATMGGVTTDRDKTYTQEQLEKIKDESEE